MGRKSKLTDEQWAEVERRIIEGASVRALAREFGISEASIRERIAKHGKTATVQEVARKIVDAEVSLAALPLSAQISAQNLAARLRAISNSLAQAAELGAATAHRLTHLANAEVQKVDDANPLESLGNLKGVAVLTKMANESAAIGLNLLAANKDRVKQLTDDEPGQAAAVPTDPIDAAQAYQKLMGG